MSVRYKAPSSSSNDDSLLDNAWFWVFIAFAAILVVVGVVKIAKFARGKGMFSGTSSSFAGNGDTEGGLLSGFW